MITTVTVSTPWSMLDSAEDTLTQRTYEDEFNYFIHPHSYDNASSPARKRQRIVPDTALATGNGKTSAEPYTQDAIRLIVCRHVTEAVRNVKFRRLQVDNLAVQVVGELVSSKSFCKKIATSDGNFDHGLRLKVELAVESLAIQPCFWLSDDMRGSQCLVLEHDDFLFKYMQQCYLLERQPVLQSLPTLAVLPSRRNRPRSKLSSLATKTKTSRQHIASIPRLIYKPYLTVKERMAIARGVARYSDTVDLLTSPLIYHVDFTDEEIGAIVETLGGTFELGVPPAILSKLNTKGNVLALVGPRLPHRTQTSIKNFLSDAQAGIYNSSQNRHILSIKKHIPARRGRRLDDLQPLLLARELDGLRGFGRTRTRFNFQAEAVTIWDDQLSVVSEYTNCAGDISTISWLPGHSFICGTTTHSDSHNQQYNKQGNLLLCSTTKDQLKAFDDHRIPRPFVMSGENSTAAMRESQDPWLYSSVVSSDYDAINKQAFTSSFDGTVKSWTVNNDGVHMKSVSTWQQRGRVNFVACAKDGSGLVAVAADVPTDAVRIYNTKASDEADTLHMSLSCSRTDANGSDRWAYFPATLQWGICPASQHLLLVGYSPRSLRDGADDDIPEEKRNTGEIALWDTRRKCRLLVQTATTANVFEVAWHPTLSRFLVATSPCGVMVNGGTKTQVHIFQQDIDRPFDCYTEFQALSCPAVDINELTFRPTSLLHAYVTAGCTDGCVYVWDTAQGDTPVHVLRHGKPIDEVHGDREHFDTGVKFTAWSSSSDRFYTGSSDGVVKVWNVRNTTQPFLRDLLKAPAPISCGAFSPDFSWLAIGDASGRVFTFSTTGVRGTMSEGIKIEGTNRVIRRPRTFIPHPEPPAPPVAGEGIQTAADLTSAEMARQYLVNNQLILHRNRVIGAVKGPNYMTTNLFRVDAHLDSDPSLPLMAEYEKLQQETQHASTGGVVRKMRVLDESAEPLSHILESLRRQLHMVNLKHDFDPSCLSSEEVAALSKDGVELEADFGFDYDD